jgi:asparagine synthase (glutamine-hydrolysing)
MLERLNGMFAIAIWDSREGALFLARDRLGVKPLYYAFEKDAFYFASEAKALIAAGIPGAFDHGTWEELLCFRFVAGENTPYAGVRKLLPGHSLLWKDGKVATKRWWNLGEKVRERGPAGGKDYANSYADTFDSAVALRLISDVPLGVFLSGGLDSSSIAASAAAHNGGVVDSYNMRFDEPGFDEGPLAEQVARQWRLRNHEFNVHSEELLPLLREASWLNDEPLAHGNDLYLYYIARYAKQQVTVLLSGEGADETLGGYVRYQMLRFPLSLGLSRRWLAPLVRRLPLSGRGNKLKRFIELGSVDKMILYNACNLFPYELSALGIKPEENFPYRHAIAEEARRYSPEPLRQAMYIDQHTFLCSLLDRNDRMTMGASIECRVPFLDYRLIEMAAVMPTRELFGEGQGKWPLRRAMRGRLPLDVLRHRKWGFGVPWTRFLREDPGLRDLVLSIADKEPLLSGPLDRKVIRNLVTKFYAGSNDNYLLILQLLMLVVWHEETFSRVRVIKTKQAAHIC